jgi:hypothetical protein
MSTFESYLDQPSCQGLAQIKSLLHLLQAQGVAEQQLRLLLTLEAILEEGSGEESLRIRLLQGLQADIKQVCDRIRVWAVQEYEPLPPGPVDGADQLPVRRTRVSIPPVDATVLEIAQHEKDEYEAILLLSHAAEYLHVFFSCEEQHGLRVHRVENVLPSS